jgi:hypothetical protein
MRRKKPSSSDSELTVHTITSRAVYLGIFRVKGDPHPYFAYRASADWAEAERDAKSSFDAYQRMVMRGVKVHDPQHLERLEREFVTGDRIEFTTQTDWSDPEIPTTLISFSKIETSSNVTRLDGKQNDK